MTAKEDNQKSWATRNRKVLEVQEEVAGTIRNLISSGYAKEDIRLFAELMIDVVKRFD